MKNYYDILGVTSQASKEQVKAAYIHLSKKYHPDVNNNDSLYTRQFQSINEAYHCLSNDQLRTQYNLGFEYQSAFNHLQQTAVQNKQQFTAKLWFKSALMASAGIAFIALFSFGIDRFDAPVVEKSNYHHHSTIQQSPATVIKTVHPIKSTAFTRANKPVSKIQLSKPVVTAIQPVATKPLIINRPFEQQELLNIVAMIDKKDLQQNGNCVKILRAANCNITNVFAVAASLQSSGIVISGRDNVNTLIEGVEVQQKGYCLQLIIGKL